MREWLPQHGREEWIHSARRCTHRSLGVVTGKAETLPPTQRREPLTGGVALLLQTSFDKEEVDLGLVHQRVDHVLRDLAAARTRTHPRARRGRRGIGG